MKFQSMNVVKLQVFTVMKIHVVVFWVVTPCNDVVGYQHFGGSMALWNVGILPHQYTTLQHRRLLHDRL